jgi:hypothetical protein
MKPQKSRATAMQQTQAVKYPFFPGKWEIAFACAYIVAIGAIRTIIIWGQERQVAWAPLQLTQTALATLAILIVLIVVTVLYAKYARHDYATPVRWGLALFLVEFIDLTLTESTSGMTTDILLAAHAFMYILYYATVSAAIGIATLTIIRMRKPIQ